MRILVYLLLVSLFVEIATPLKIFRFKGNNSIMYNIYTPVEIIFFASIYYAALKTRRQRKFVLIITAITLAFDIYNFWFLQGKGVFNSYSFIASCIGMTLFAFVYLIELYSATTIVRFYTDPLFWVSIGILFFYPPSIFSTGPVADIYRKYPILAVKIYKINDILNVLRYCSFLLAIYMASFITRDHHIVSYE